MDLRDKPILYTHYSLDDETGIVTISIRDDSNIELGSIVIENSKYRSFLRAMTLMSEERVTSIMEQVGYRTTYDVQKFVGLIEFGGET